MESSQNKPLIKPIVLKDLVAEKNPKLASRIPGFVYSLLNRILHVESCNQIIANYGHLHGVPFIDAVVSYFDVEVTYHGLENLPAAGRYIFASNHPLGGFDGMLLLKGVTENMGPALFLVRDELTKIPTLKELFIPINKFGDQRESASQIRDAYESDSQILIFPSGLASRKVNGKVVDLVWHKHFIQKSIEFQRDVIPVFISGQNSKLFYRLANFRKAIGLKINIEMFLLVDELFRQRGRSIAIHFGKPIPNSTFDRSHSPSQWAAKVREKVYQLVQKVN